MRALLRAEVRKRRKRRRTLYRNGRQIGDDLRVTYVDASKAQPPPLQNLLQVADAKTKIRFQRKAKKM